MAFMREEEEVQLDLRFDAHGYATYDGGEELRRLGLVLWHDRFGGEAEEQRYAVKYLGCSRIPGFSLALLLECP